MSSEADRQALYARLEEVLGEQHAATLMTNLPPTPWDQLATKDDLDGLEARFDGLEARFDGLARVVDQIAQRLFGVETRFEGLDARLGRMEHQLDVAAERFLDLHTFQLGLHKNYTVTMVSGLVAVTAIFAALLTVTSLM